MPISKLFTFLLVFSCFTTASDKQQRADAIWQKSLEISTFTSETRPSYRAKVEFTLITPEKKEIKGEFIKDFLDSAHYRTATTTADYREVYVRNGNKAWRSEGVEDSPYSTVVTMSPPIVYFEKDNKVSHVFSMKQDGQPLECVEYKKITRSYCFDAEGKLIRRATESITVVYSQFREFSGKQVPTHFDLAMYDNNRISADVKLSPASDLTESLFEPPSSAGLKPVPIPCKGGTPPKGVSMPDPVLPKGGKQGTVILRGIVGTDGRMRDVRVIRSLAAPNDQEAVKAVQEWIFRPSTCEGQIRETEITVEINFRSP